MRLATYTKQPRERKDYDIDYASWLGPIADTLDEVTAVVECLSNPSDTSLVCDTVLYTATRAKFWVTGGTDGERYKLTASANTVGGRDDESELIFTIKDY